MKSFFEKEDTVLCGVVVAELLHGAVSEKNLTEITRLLSGFELLAIDDTEWTDFGKMLYRLRINGLTVPFQDALIAFIAICNHVPLRTNDSHFRLIHTIIPDLELFSVQQPDSIQ